jgi:predicted ATP-grasp superfamily ATP-dependent carboligase
MSDAAHAALPGVVVLGADSQIGLAVIRDLGQGGVPVHAIGRTPDAIGLHSKYVRSAHVHTHRDHTLVDLLNRIAAEQGAKFLMTISERDISFLNEVRPQLIGLTPLIPSPERMGLVLDKARVYAVAERLGIDVPRSVAVDAQGMPDTDGIRFPVVLKWADPLAVIPLLRAHGLSLIKAEYCHDLPELEAALARYRPLGRYPLVQEYCPGVGLGQMFCMHQGVAVLRFQHLRLHEWPPEGGYSTLCESLPPDQNPELMKRSEALLGEIGWEGPAMVEYRFDRTSGRATLMEINGRFWGSMPLAWHAGARFPWLMYNLMGRGVEVSGADTYRSGVRCKFLLPDLKRLWRILRYPERIQDRSLRFDRLAEVAGFVAFLLDPRSRYYVFSWSDPGPFLAELRQLARRLPGRS